MREHLRDCKGWQLEGLEMSTTSDQAAKLFDHALDQLLSHTSDIDAGGIEGDIVKMKEHDPNFIMGHVLELTSTCGYKRLSEVAQVKVDLLNSLMKTSTINDRELSHCHAAIAYSNEHLTEALSIWEEILFIYPRDTLAMKLSFSGYLILGNSVMLRDMFSRVLPFWSKSDYEYGYLLNMYAFGLEETNLWDQAQTTVDEGLTLIPNDSWGIHTQAHIYESVNKPKEGIAFMTKTENLWNTNNTLSCHNYWHLCLNYIENNQHEHAVTLYDEQLVKLYKKSKLAFNINDACQLLQRLEFESIYLGTERWDDLYAVYKSNKDTHDWVYNDCHLLNVFLKSKVSRNENANNDFMASVKSYIDLSDGDNSERTRDIGMSVFSALTDYHDGDFESAARKFYSVKNDVFKVGGSHAQRDFFNQYLINACMQSRDKKINDMGVSLCYERKSFMPNSPLTDRLLDKMLAVHI